MARIGCEGNSCKKQVLKTKKNQCPFCHDYFCIKHIAPKQMRSGRELTGEDTPYYEHPRLDRQAHPCAEWAVKTPTEREIIINEWTGKTSQIAGCAKCGKADYLPIRCRHCRKPYCSEHRLPEDHGCKPSPLVREPEYTQIEDDIEFEDLIREPEDGQCIRLSDNKFKKWYKRPEFVINLVIIILLILWTILIL